MRQPGPLYFTFRWVAFASLFLASLFGVSCNKDEAKFQMVYEGFYSDNIKSLDPAMARDSLSVQVVSNIYEPLYQYHYLHQAYRIAPLLAADLPKTSSDGKTVTIKIRQDVRFAPDPGFGKEAKIGRKLEVRDVLYSLKRLAHPKLNSPGWWLLDGKIVGFNRYRERLKNASPDDFLARFNEKVEGLNVLDSQTIQLQLTRPLPQIASILALPVTSIVPIEAVERYGDPDGALHSGGVGTGPYRLHEWKKGFQIHLLRNPQYHPEFYPTEGTGVFSRNEYLADNGKTLPFVDRIILRLERDEPRRWNEFLARRVPLIQLSENKYQSVIDPSGNLLPELQKQGIRKFASPQNTFFYISFNLKDPLLGKNKSLRQAISSAINREEIISEFMGHISQKATTVLPPGVEGRPQDPVLKYDYDPDRSKKLLKQAGFPNGKDLPVIKLDMRSNDRKAREMGKYLEFAFRQVGIKIRVIYNTFPDFLKKSQESRFQLLLGGWTLDYPDAENAYQLLYGPNHMPGPNESYFNHPEFNQKFKKLLSLKAGEERTSIIADLDAIVQEEVPWALLVYRNDIFLTHSWLKNFRGDRTIPNGIKYLRVDPKPLR